MPESRHLKKPAWLKRKLPSGGDYEAMRQLISANNLNTVCKEANCPNRFECYQKGTATFLILGDHCTRNCRFCAVQQGTLSSPDDDEPKRVAAAIKDMGLSYTVITSVTRDDLSDGGAEMFARTIRAVRTVNPHIRVEVLVPDFKGDASAIRVVVNEKPDVFGHNMETVKRLYPKARPEAIYDRSLDVLRTTKAIRPDQVTKSGIMVGLGETLDEIKETCDDLVTAGCDMLSIGQYLSPSKKHLQVEEYISPDTFTHLKEIALRSGLKQVASGPFVRSSYEASELFHHLRISKAYSRQQ